MNPKERGKPKMSAIIYLAQITVENPDWGEEGKYPLKKNRGKEPTGSVSSPARERERGEGPVSR